MNIMQFLGKAYTFREVEISETKSALFIFDNSGFAVTKEDVEKLITKLNDSLENINWENVTEYNKQKEILIDEEMNSYRGRNKEQKPKTKQKGYIYFVKDDSNNVKIGRTKDVNKRFGEYTKLAFEPIVLNVLKSDDTISDELHYHEMFAHKHKRGEWFELDKRDINYIKKLKQIAY